MKVRRLRAVALLPLLGLVMLLGAGSRSAGAQTEGPLVSSRYDARLRFRVLATPRADIYFHHGEDRLAQRLAQIIDEVVPAVDRRLGAPAGRLRVILVDQTDQSNGWATVVPYNLIEIAAVPPPGRSVIGNTDDWLRLVFTHEYTHVAHLAQSRGWAGGLRRLFGRLPIFYPNLFLPDWQIEGLATFEESAITGEGRVPAPDFRMLLDVAAATGRFAPMDRATSAVIDWPGGHSSYLYGAYFHQYLADRFGADSLGALSRAAAGRLPFFGSRAYPEVFGASLGELWRDFARETSARAMAAGGTARRRLTHHGFTVTSPAFAPDGRLFYSRSDPHGFPALMEWRSPEEPREVTSRYQGGGLAVGGGLLVFDQLEFDGPVALYGDLYARPLQGGDTRRLTRAARAADPDLAPDGTTIICTVQQAGRRVLATLTLPIAGDTASPEPFVAEDDVEFTAPRWSPDGRRIAAERRRLGGPSELVVIDVASGELRTVVSSADARNIAPVWLPDGSGLLFSSDREGPFTLYRLDLASGEVVPVAGAGIGARSPALSPDGKRMVFVGYSADGYDLYELPAEVLGRAANSLSAALSPTTVSPIAIPAAPVSDPSPAPASPVGRPYTPWATLAPRFWLPYVEAAGDQVVVGAATGGFDALGRHTYAATAGWGVPHDRLDLSVDYAYTRWRPTIFAGAADETDRWREGTRRARELTVGVLLPWRQVRWTAGLLGAVSASSDEVDCPSCDTPLAVRRERRAVRVGASVSTVKSFGYSISAEQGAALHTVLEFARGDAGASATSVVSEGRGYVRVFPRHAVLAARMAAAGSRGDEQARREFSAGGSGPQGGGFGLGTGAVGLLRGFAPDDVSGRSAAVVNVDYRVPLGWPQRGLGTWPLFLRAVHGAVFMDVGQAWNERFAARELRRSLGGELAMDVVLGGAVPVTIAAGAAWRHDPQGRRDGGALFVRLGRAF